MIFNRKKRSEKADLEFSHRVYNSLCRLEREGLIKDVCTPAAELIRRFNKIEEEMIEE